MYTGPQMYQYGEQSSGRPEGHQSQNRTAWQGHIGRWRERLVVLNVVTTLMLVVGMAIVLWQSSLVVEPPVLIGRAADFPPGSITEIMLETTFVDPVAPAFQQRVTVSPVPAYLVHDPTEGFFVWYRRDPHSGCDFPWVEQDELFIDPCHGSAYSRTGAYVRGPSTRSLDRFGVTTNADGVIVVDVRAFQPGKTVR